MTRAPTIVLATGTGSLLSDRADAPLNAPPGSIGLSVIMSLANSRERRMIIRFSDVSVRCFSTARSPPHGIADANATVYPGMRSPIHEGGSVRTGGVEVYDSRSAQIRIFPIRRDHSDAIELGE